MARLEAARAAMKAATASPTALAAAGIMVNQDGVRRSAFELAAQPHLTIEALARVWPELGAIDASLARRVEADAKYAVYLDRQDEDVARYRRSEAATIPADFDYSNLSGLSNELKAKFIAARPASLGQAGRIEGATPAALALIAAHARRRTRRRESRGVMRGRPHPNPSPVDGRGALALLPLAGEGGEPKRPDEGGRAPVSRETAPA